MREKLFLSLKKSLLMNMANSLLGKMKNIRRIAANGVASFVTWKGKEAEYINTLNLVKLIDLSSNNLVGDVPAEITNLVMLVGLNLSRNNLSGFLPVEKQNEMKLKVINYHC
ncbi:unnamed protein product [Fraxinus pennsylvanica]|uniref:Leucine-rich repeat protein n=1 Tax=Fraxinus pennsylvanica TaxID=56036 RepID=A0AAD1ZVH3_9LAMI|nr:unnamed protein product [Fraxinus pennsylvanica]